jgi:uncharacterized protein
MAMEMDHSFTVPVPPDQAWDVLLDVQRIAPCMPGATVDEVDGDVVNGRIKVKVGPVSLTYKGTAKFTERDPEAHVVVLEASGKETRGAGTASANVRAAMAPDASGSGTEVTMHTTMNVTGRPAQFGRGVMVEVGGKLVEQFAANLAKLITEDVPAGSGGTGDPSGSAQGTASAPPGTSGGSGVNVDSASASAVVADPPAGDGSANATSAPAAGPGTLSAVSASAPEPDNSLNLVKLVGPVLLKRLVPVAAAAAVLAVLSGLVWRRRRGQAAKA